MSPSFLLVMVSGTWLAQTSPSDLATAAAAPLAEHAVASPAVPEIMFEIRELSMASPDWRGAMQPMLNPVARDEAVSAWAVDSSGLRRLLEICQDDPRSRILQAPRLTARMGEMVRMTNEETVHYVARLRRISDAPINQGTELAFEPQPAEIHEGIRVELTETRMKGPLLLARVDVRSNTLRRMLTTQYEEGVLLPEADPGIVKASLPTGRKPKPTSLRGTIQIPEVDSRRIEGEWLIPSEGAIVVSMGPDSNARIDRATPGEKTGLFGAKGAKRGYVERVICITAIVKPAAEPISRP